mmetsp:Transcript_13513/g.21065  ORF Transcript_13513/g.21065 Transcript_13513/m.21065 type:complete len:100 (-) Transcript_13513:238-537(-)
MDNPELTVTFPRSNVQSNRLPRRRTGYIALAARANLGSSLLAMTISRPLGSSDMRPSVKPENMAENKTSTTTSTHCTASGIGDFAPSQVQAVALASVAL